MKKTAKILTALLAALFLLPGVTANAADKPRYQQVEEAEKRLTELEAEKKAMAFRYGATEADWKSFDPRYASSADFDRYYELADEMMKINNDFGKYINNKYYLGSLRLYVTPAEWKQLQDDPIALVEKSGYDVNEIFGFTPEEEPKPQKPIYSASDVLGFVTQTVVDMTDILNCTAPEGTTVDRQDVIDYVLANLDSGNYNGWTRTEWVRYTEKWTPVYTLPDGTKTDEAGAKEYAAKAETNVTPDTDASEETEEPAETENNTDAGTTTPADKTEVKPADKIETNNTAADAAAKAEAEKKAAEEAAKKAAEEAAAKKAAEEAAAKKAAEEAAAKKAAEEAARKAAEEAAKKAAEEAAKAEAEANSNKIDMGGNLIVTDNGDGTYTADDGFTIYYDEEGNECYRYE